MASICRILLFTASLLLSVSGTASASETAIFAGGCFWCLEHDFAKVSGVESVISGFCDYGRQYRPVIFYLDEKQERLAKASKMKISIQPNKVEIAPATKFYPAREYHQDYAERNPIRYNFYRYRCGRDARLEELWGAP